MKQQRFASWTSDTVKPMKLSAVLAFSLGCHSPTTPAVSTIPHAPANFRVVRTGLARGGHPDVASLDFLRAQGVGTIVDLEIDDGIEATTEQIQTEVAEAEARGFRVYQFPMSAFEPALSDRFDLLVERTLSVIARPNPIDPTRTGVYVHCLHGQDRTGLIIGLERVDQEQWTAERAYAEMLVDGFHPMFLGLREYFERHPSGRIAR